MNDAQTPEPPRHLPAEHLEPWLTALAQALQLDERDVPLPTVLDVARDVARGVTRPAAPLSTFLVGLAAAKNGGDEDAVRAAARVASELAREWSARDDGRRDGAS